MPIVSPRNCLPNMSQCFLSVNSVECKIVKEQNNSLLNFSIVLLPEECLYTNTNLQYILKRHQFPLRLAFAMTINKTQGQTFARVGLLLQEKPVFTHRQLYVAFPCVRTLDSIQVKLKPRIYKTRNVVLNEGQEFLVTTEAAHCCHCRPSARWGSHHEPYVWSLTGGNCPASPSGHKVCHHRLLSDEAWPTGHSRAGGLRLNLPLVVLAGLMTSGV
ncbi:hypothetical protein LAZ67_2004152, partial [Cordylochernes scorpioides]